MRRALLVLVIALAGLLAAAVPAHADGEGVVCEVVDPRTQECWVWAPGDDGGGGGGGSGGGGGGGEAKCYTSDGAEIACTLASGALWSATYQCYVDPEPITTDPTDGHLTWAGRTTGAIYWCGPDPEGLLAIGRVPIWLPGPPTPGPNPIDLAMDAVSSMRLSLGSVQTTPPRGSDPSVVGLPIWFWIENPGPSTTGPITISASAGGVTVTATATLDRVEYELQTERQILSTTCSGASAPGTPYYTGAGEHPSPTCGFTAQQNNKTGTGTLTASAYWTVEWTGGGQGGTITLPAMTRSYPFEITEIQSIRISEP
ncbi:hypothetical protein [Salana multivorans]